LHPLAIRFRPAVRLRLAAPSAGLVLLAVGAAVRMRVFAANHSYWYDEAYLLLNVFARSYRDLVGRLDLNQVVAPGYAWLERLAYDLFGPAEWAMRLPAFVAGLLALAAVAAAGRRVVPAAVAWLPLAFAALSRHAVGHGCEVKPYTLDLAVAAAVLAAVGGVLGRSRRAAVGLVAVAAAGPWLSFPSAFALAGAVAAVALVRRKLAILAGATAAASAAAVWWVHGRHQYTPDLAAFWGPGGMGGFPDLRSPLAAAWWPVKAAIDVGNYGTREMGVLLAPLALLGVVSVARRSLPVAVALVVPPVLAAAAAYLGKYPIAQRTGVFLLPGLWVAAALGVAAVVARWPRWGRLLPVVLLAADVFGTLQFFASPPWYPACREAFAQVRAERRPGDAVWVGHPEVWQVYHPSEPFLGFPMPPAAWERGFRTAGRAWVVYQPAPGEESLRPELADRLRAAGLAPRTHRRYPGVWVELWSAEP
jgi:hypothetical protein